MIGGEENIVGKGENTDLKVKEITEKHGYVRFLLRYN